MLELVELRLILNLTWVTYVRMITAECNNKILSMNRSLIKKFSGQHSTKQQPNGEGMTVAGHATVVFFWETVIHVVWGNHWQPTNLVIWV